VQLRLSAISTRNRKLERKSEPHALSMRLLSQTGNPGALLAATTQTQSDISLRHDRHANSPIGAQRRARSEFHDLQLSTATRNVLYPPGR
jgi:hypothetical protein